MMRRIGPPAALLLLLIGGWESACRWFAIPVFILPPPSRVIDALWQWREPLLTHHLPITLMETLIGLGLSVVLGLVLAILMHLSPTLDRAFYPLIVASQTVPVIAISPVFLFWFGYTLQQKVAVVVLIAFFPLAVAVRDGLRSADPDLIEWLHAAGASRWRTLAMAEVPAALPAFFSGLKIAVSVSVIGAVLGEWLGGNGGLGVFGRRAAANLKAPELFASVVLLALLGNGLYLLAAWAEHLSFAHRRGR